MKIILKRRYLGPLYTIGSLFIDNKYFSDTIEDKVRDVNKNGVFDGGEQKIYSETAIPYGEYKIIITFSPKFKRELPLLLDVPSFTGIRIHRGNTAKDTAGCIIPGENKVKGKVINSTPYEDKLISLMKEASSKGETITIKII